MNHYATTPAYRARRRALAAFVIVGVLAGLFIATAPNSHAQTAGISSSGYSVPRCYEDQVIARHGRCLFRDDRTTRFARSTGSKRGYWYDTRYPSALRATPRVPACYKHQMVTRYGGCVAVTLGDFRGGYWYHRGAR